MFSVLRFPHLLPDCHTSKSIIKAKYICIVLVLQQGKKKEFIFSLVLPFITNRSQIYNFLGREGNPHLVYSALILATNILAGALERREDACKYCFGKTGLSDNVRRGSGNGKGEWQSAFASMHLSQLGLLTKSHYQRYPHKLEDRTAKSAFIK